MGGYEGSYDHEQQDANTYAKWGVDFLKYDLCSYMEIMKLHDPHQDPQKALAMMQEAYGKMHQALVNNTSLHRLQPLSVRCRFRVGVGSEGGGSVAHNR